MGRSGKKKSNNHNGVNANIFWERESVWERVSERVAKETVNLGNIKSNKTAVSSPFKPNSHTCVHVSRRRYLSRVYLSFAAFNRHTTAILSTLSYVWERSEGVDVG